jgi:hypothetical protein
MGCQKLVDVICRRTPKKKTNVILHDVQWTNIMPVWQRLWDNPIKNLCLKRDSIKLKILDGGTSI